MPRPAIAANWCAALAGGCLTRCVMRYLEAGKRHMVRFTLNGQMVEGEAEPRLLLSDFLRQTLGAHEMARGPADNPFYRATGKLLGVHLRLLHSQS